MQISSASVNSQTNVATRFAKNENVSGSKSSPKLVRGVGRNDADYLVHAYSNIDGRQKRLWICPFYVAWTGMLERCYSAKFQKRNPAYIGCSVSEEWLSFSEFRSWMSEQDYEGKHLDKDILAPGNKHYSPETCAFVTAKLNNFLTGSTASRGERPVGAGMEKGRVGFTAYCRNPFTGKNEYLGMFAIAGAAHEAWRARKHKHACAYASLQVDHRIAEALLIRFTHKTNAETAAMQEAA